MVAAATALMAPVPHASEHRPYLAPRAFCAVNDAFRLPPPLTRPPRDRRRALGTIRGKSGGGHRGCRPTQWAADPGVRPRSDQRARNGAGKGEPRAAGQAKKCLSPSKSGASVGKDKKGEVSLCWGVSLSRKGRNLIAPGAARPVAPL